MGEQVGKIPMWSDLGLGRLTDWEDLDFKLAFLMDTYQVVSLEKCLFRGLKCVNFGGLKCVGLK